MPSPAQHSPSAPLTPPKILAPHKRLFAARALRFAQLAPQSRFKPWLNALSELASQQQHALDTLAPPLLPAPLPGHPHLPASAFSLLAPYWKKTCQALYPRLFALLAAQVGGHPQALSDGELENRAEQCLRLANGEILPAQRDAHDVLVAAALQVVWSAAAQNTGWPESARLDPAADGCPFCGAAPVGGIILAGDGKAGLRYLECGLCATRWHAVRAHCTLCEANASVTYLGDEAGNPAIQAETCDACQGYVKLCFQTRDPLVDPVADDLATLSLDIAVGEAGYARASPNLFYPGIAVDSA